METRLFIFIVSVASQYLRIIKMRVMSPLRGKKKKLIFWQSGFVDFHELIYIFGDRLAVYSWFLWTIVLTF